MQQKIETKLVNALYFVFDYASLDKYWICHELTVEKKKNLFNEFCKLLLGEPFIFQDEFDKKKNHKDKSPKYIHFAM